MSRRPDWISTHCIVKLCGLRPLTTTPDEEEMHMADLPPNPETGDNTGDGTGVGPDRGSITGTPRWVKVFGIIALIVVLLFVILLLTGGPGGHGPSRHMAPGGGGGHTPAGVRAP